MLLLNSSTYVSTDGGRYEQAPYEVPTNVEYDIFSRPSLKIDYSKLSEYGPEDNAEIKPTLACTGNFCEIP